MARRVIFTGKLRHLVGLFRHPSYVQPIKAERRDGPANQQPYTSEHKHIRIFIPTRNIAELSLREIG